MQKSHDNLVLAMDMQSKYRKGMKSDVIVDFDKNPEKLEDTWQINEKLVDEFIQTKQWSAKLLLGIKCSC